MPKLSTVRFRETETPDAIEEEVAPEETPKPQEEPTPTPDPVDAAEDQLAQDGYVEPDTMNDLPTTDHLELNREQREEELQGLGVAELRKILKGDYDLPARGTKPVLIDRILDHEHGPTATETPEEPSEAEEAPQPRKGRTSARKTSRQASPDRLGALFTPLSDVEEYSRVLYYGKEGSAKTTNLLTLSQHGRMLLINAEGGVKKKALVKHGVNLDNVQVWPPEGQPITFEGLREVFFQVKSDLEDDPKAWIGIGFDSITDITQGILDQVSTHRVDKTRNRGIDVDLMDSFFVDRDDYGTMSKMMRQLMRSFRDLPTHVVYTALERRDVDEDTGKVAYGPALSPAVGTDLMGYVDLVLYCRAADEDQDVFRAVSKQAGKYRVKDRDGVLPRVLVNPTMVRILEYIGGDLEEDTDEEQKKLTTPPPPEAKPSGRKTTRKTTTQKENA